MLWITIALIIVLEYLQIKNIFPVTEGWWEVYAWIYNNGSDLYAEANLKFPPLFILLINFLINTLNFNFYEERIFFLCIRIITVLITYLWLRRYYGKYESLFGSFVPALLIYSNPVYLTKDYHVLVALLVGLILYILSGKFIRGVNNKANFSAIFVGLICSLLFLTKQNIGLFFTFGLLLYFIKVEIIDLNINISRFLGKLFLAFSGFIFPIFIASIITPNWYQILIGNDAKGSLITVLFRFLLDINSLIYLIFTFALIIFSIGWRFLIKSNVHLLNIHDKYRFEFLAVIFAFSIAMTIKSSFLIICLSLAWPVVRLIYTSPSHIRFEPYVNSLWIILYSYAYCGTNTAGYNYVSVDYLIAFYVAGALQLISKRNWFDYYKVKYLLLFSVIVFLAAPKLSTSHGYNWWGLKSGNVFQSKTVLPYIELDGLYTDKYTANIFEKVKEYNSKLEFNDNFFAYPSIPIFYYLERQNPIGQPLLWFDVSSSKDAANTIEILEKNPPKFIYWLKPPRSVYAGHFNLRKSDPSMLLVDDWLFTNLKNGKYKILDTLLTYDDSYNFDSREFSKIIKIQNTLHLDFYNNLCLELNGCFIGLPNMYSFESGASYSKFVSFAKDIISTDAHIFYVLKLQ